MNIDSIENGIVIDHIKARKGMEIYKKLNLRELDCSVALITNAKSKKMGTKDIIKINQNIEVNMDMIGFIDPDVTINIVENDKLVQKYNVTLPEKIINVTDCQNPRCITSVEDDLDQIFILTDKENKTYRCEYCETRL